MQYVAAYGMTQSHFGQRAIGGRAAKCVNEARDIKCCECVQSDSVVIVKVSEDNATYQQRATATRVHESPPGVAASPWPCDAQVVSLPCGIQPVRGERMSRRLGLPRCTTRWTEKGVVAFATFVIAINLVTVSPLFDCRRASTPHVGSSDLHLDESTVRRNHACAITFGV